MDNKNTIAATIGIGAIGSVLAYYGYNKLTNSSSEKTNDESFVTGGNGIGTPSDLKPKPHGDIKEQVTMEIRNTSQTQPASETTPPKDDNTTKWKKFWKNEFHSNSVSTGAKQTEEE